MDTMMFGIGFMLFLFIPTKQALHIFQQQHYHLDRYQIWLLDKLEEKKGQLLYPFLCYLPMLALVLISSHPHILALEALLLLIYAYIMMKIDDDRRYVKPFNYTPRILRQLFFQYLLYLLCFASLHVLPMKPLLIITPLCYGFTWVLIIISGWCMNLVETKIQHFYVKDAKRILARNPNLLKIGITGSYGKTSVKTILQTMLSNQYYSLMTPHSYNNLMGITITIRSQLKDIHEAFICEMGADHQHEIERLVQFVQPQIGIVTAIGPQHLQTFHTIENILEEKMKLIEQLPVNGIAFLNRDNHYLREYPLKNKVTLIWFSIDETSDFQASHIHYHEDGMTFLITHQSVQYLFETKLLGEHHVRNITAAVAVAFTLGIPMVVLQQTIRQLPYVEHRLQVRKTDTYTLLDNAYNSNPEGAKESLEVLRQMPGKHLVITPGFIELGKLQEEAHQTFGKQISKVADEVILIGEIQTKAIKEGLLSQAYPLLHIHVVSSTKEALQIVETYAKKGDTVLLENDLPDAFNH